MELVKILSKGEQTLKESPLKKIINRQLKSPVFIDELLFQDESQKFEQLLSRTSESLNMVIIGEVKAGKSTILNAFAGSRISPVDVSEATSTVIEIKYSDEPYGKIYMGDEVIVGTPDEIFKILGENNNNQEFFRLCNGAEFGYNTSNLMNFTIVDTPGLGSVTQENEKRTKEFISKTDVVLWVFNGHHLGQVNIVESLIDINLSGKPVIALINRIDEIDGDPEELIAYLEGEIGMYVQKIFAVSGRQALLGQLESNQELIDSSGFRNLVTYVDNHINKNVDVLKDDILLKSAEALLNRDILIHDEYLNALNFLVNKSEQISNRIIQKGDAILKDTMYEFENWYASSFLRSEERKLVDTINDSNVFNLKSKKVHMNDEINYILTEEYLSNLINEYLFFSDEQYLSKWREALIDIKDTILIEIEEFQTHASEELQMRLANQDYIQSESSMVDGLTKGAVLGGATGAASAFYAAVLGPAASSISLGTAAFILLPEFLIVGAAIGIASALLKFKSDKGDTGKKVEDIFKNVRSELHPVLMLSVNRKYSESNSKMIEKINSLITESLSYGSNMTSIGELKFELEKYLITIKKFKEELVLQKV